MATSWVDQITGNGETVAYKAPCRVATTADVILSGLLTVDGVTLAADDRVLVTSQAVASQNGIYIAASGPWQRARDFDSNRDVTKGTRVTVTDGATNAGREYVLTSANPIHVGTSAIVITETLSSDAGGSAAAAAASAAAALISEQSAEADAIATAADRLQTGLDAAATAADRVQTGLDRAAAAADRAQADLDAVATAADRVQTGADRIATAADRVQTGVDASNASSAANLAGKWATEAEDTPVAGGLFSAFHWAQKAAGVVTGSIAAAIHVATGKTTPTGADELPIADSAASWGLKKLTLTNLRAWLAGTPFVPVTSSTSNADWDTLVTPGWHPQLVYALNDNSPGGSDYYFLFNADYGSGFTVEQIAFPRRTVTGRVAMRSRHNGEWEAWKFLPWADAVLALAGGTMTGPLALMAGTTAAAPIHIPPGVAPTTPANGNLWAQANGALIHRRGGTSRQIWDDGELNLVSQVDAEAGVSTNWKLWSAQRVKQAIDALAQGLNEYVSAEQTITAAGTVTLSHGLGVAPKLVRLTAVCKTAEQGYSVNDVLDLNPGMNSTSSLAAGLSVVTTASAIVVRFGSYGNLNAIHKTSGVVVDLTAANWRLIARAYA